MARKLIEMKEEDGGNILVAVDVPEKAIRKVAANSGEQVIDKVEQSFDTVKDLIVRGCRPLTEAFDTLYTEGKATNAEVEFGLNFTAKGNIYVVESVAAASLKVKVTWDLTKKGNS